MQGHSTFRKKAMELTKKSVSLLKKLNPEPALSRMKLNHELAKAMSPFNINEVDWGLVKSLVAAGANPNMKRNDDYRTPLLVCAARRAELDTCKLLLEKGANVDSIDKRGFTALTVAAQEGHVWTCRLLLENGANVEGYNKDGITPLMLAAQNQHPDTCALLLEYGANAEVKNRKYGANALMLAESGGPAVNKETVAILKLGILLGKGGFKPFRINFRECIQ